MVSNLFFTTATVVAWTDIFTRSQYRDLLYESWDFARRIDRFKLHAYVIMTNHIHLIASGDPENFRIYHGRMKQYISSQIHQRLADDFQESRRGWMHDRFTYAGLTSSSHKDFKFWKHSERDIFPLWTPKIMTQKLHYIHENPVKMGLVDRPEDWLYSSARQYLGGAPTFLVDALDILW